ncbi:MAG: desulfoferrodoxin FeS4 iron-binding domain-containing protein [Candidatus Heimdallarchaeaceae archaeon]
MAVKEVNEKYRCNICGNEVIVTKVGGGTLVCCGEEMELIEPKKEESVLEEGIEVGREEETEEAKIGKETSFEELEKKEEEIQEKIEKVSEEIGEEESEEPKEIEDYEEDIEAEEEE